MIQNECVRNTPEDIRGIKEAKDAAVFAEMEMLIILDKIFSLLDTYEEFVKVLKERGIYSEISETVHQRSEEISKRLQTAP